MSDELWNFSATQDICSNNYKIGFHASATEVFKIEMLNQATYVSENNHLIILFRWEYCNFSAGNMLAI